MFIIVRLLDMSQQKRNSHGVMEAVITEYDIGVNTDNIKYVRRNENDWSSTITYMNDSINIVKHPIDELLAKLSGNKEVVMDTKAVYNPETTKPEPVHVEEPVKKGPFGRPIKSGTTSSSLE